MPIHVPGKRDRRGNKAGAKRKVVAVLSLTAMVDLFTVLVVFLLQNYNVTGEIIELPKGVELPSAAEVKELKPANVVVVSADEIRLNNVPVIAYKDVNEQEAWVIEKLRLEIVKIIEEGQKEKESMRSKIKQAVQKVGEDDKAQEDEVDKFKKITISADKNVSFLSVKKVMYTVTEAGISEINFAVLKKIGEETVN